MALVPGAIETFSTGPLILKVWEALAYNIYSANEF